MKFSLDQLKKEPEHQGAKWILESAAVKNNQDQKFWDKTWIIQTLY